MNPDGINELRIAIINQAVKDYSTGYRESKRTGGKPLIMQDAETFLRSEWCEQLADVDGLNADTLLKGIREQVDHDYGKLPEF